MVRAARVLFAAAVALCAFAGSGMAADPIGQVVALVGSPTSSGRALSAGSAVYENDRLETGGSYRIVLSPRLDREDILSTSLDFDVYRTDVATMEAAWVALSSALNSFNRSMGLPDAYPFVLTPAVNEKLAFVHDLLRSSR